MKNGIVFKGTSKQVSNQIDTLIKKYGEDAKLVDVIEARLNA